jgi:hypothetical protein
MQYERQMRAITEDEYFRRLQSKNTWWNRLCKQMTLDGKTERVTWLLSTAMIEPVGPTGSGGLSFENMVTQTVEYPTMRHGKGIKVTRDEIEDLEGTGLNILAEWSKQIGNETAYYPQRLAATLLLNGANTDGSANAYDGVPFFADNSSRTIGGVSVKGHPYNPYRPSLGGYSNWLHGLSSGSYPGALPIDDSQTVDTALTNLGKAIAYVAGVKMPNGVDPRFLTPAYIVAPPRMAPRIRELTKAAFIAQVAGSGAGSADVKAVIEGWGLGTPVIAAELGAAITYNTKMPFMGSGGNVKLADESLTGSDTTYYLVCEENMSTQLGGLLYVNRKPFKVNYYTGDAGGTGQDAVLDRANEFEYHVQGRMAVQYGHPYAVFRFDGS